MPTDQWGMPLSTTPENAAGYDAYVESMSSFAADEEDRARALTEVDPDFALGRAIWAFTAAFNGVEGVDVRAEVAAAHAGQAQHEWERSLRDALCRIAADGPWTAYPHVLRHNDAFPGDLVGLEVRTFLQSASTEPDRRLAITAAAHAALDAVGPNPSSCASLGFFAEELGELDAATQWNDRLLDLRPAHILGAHVAAHVNFERGEHAAGLAWLADWMEVGDRESPYFGHLRWHAGLHELATGDEAAALATLQACSTAAGSSTQLSDTSGLALRCQFAGILPPGEMPTDDVLDERIAGFVDIPPMATPFGLFQVLALGAKGDADTLRRYAAAAAGWDAPGAAELLPGLASAYADFVEGAHAAAADGFLALEGRFDRYGGSRAQWEVLGDTLIESLIRSGRPEEAIARIDARLDARESRLDRLRRERALASSGRVTASS